MTSTCPTCGLEPDEHLCPDPCHRDRAEAMRDALVCIDKECQHALDTGIGYTDTIHEVARAALRGAEEAGNG